MKGPPTPTSTPTPSTRCRQQIAHALPLPLPPPPLPLHLTTPMLVPRYDDDAMLNVWARARSQSTPRLWTFACTKKRVRLGPLLVTPFLSVLLCFFLSSFVRLPLNETWQSASKSWRSTLRIEHRLGRAGGTGACQKKKPYAVATLSLQKGFGFGAGGQQVSAEVEAKSGSGSGWGVFCNWLSSLRSFRYITISHAGHDQGWWPEVTTRYDVRSSSGSSCFPWATVGHMSKSLLLLQTGSLASSPSLIIASHPLEWQWSAAQK